MENKFEMAVRFVLLLNGETPNSFTEKVKLSPQYFSMLVSGRRNNLQKKKEIWNKLFDEIVGDENN